MSPQRTPPTAETLEKLRHIAGDNGWIDTPVDIEPFVHEWRDRYVGKTPLVLLPNSVEKISAILRVCQETGTPIVPQGGNTGAVAGGIPFEDGAEVVLSLTRLNKIRGVDPLTNTMTVDGGVVLQTIQETADKYDRLFPLSLASEGSCQIGGNLATNAGGTAVLSYGNARDLVMGLEVVLANGDIWNGLTGLRKDNTGYDLKHLFMGSEGTLGIITGAVLKLFPKPVARETCFLGIADPKSAIQLLSEAQSKFGKDVTTFELMCRRGIDFVLAHQTGTRDPLSEECAWYLLMEVTTSLSGLDLKSSLEAFLSDASQNGLVLDGVVAASDAQRQKLWAIREGIPEAQKPEGGSIKHDVSVPVSAIPEFLDRATQAVADFLPGARPVPFGHVGDGNIHFNISQPTDMAREDFIALWEEVNALVHDIVVALGGSISAEHGIGRMKVDELARYKDPVALDLMRTLKKSLDPNNILNPGKVVRV